MKIYCQGQIVPEEEAKISARDHGFLYGASLFETFRTYDGEPLFLAEHIARLTASCAAFGILPGDRLLLAHPPALSGMRKTIRELLAQNNLKDAVFRYTLSAGEMPSGLPQGLYEHPAEILSLRPLPPPVATARLHLLETARTEPEVFPRPKSAHYMNSLIAYREVSRRDTAPGDEGLMLTRDGRLAEAVVSNLFLVVGDRLATPAPSAHILSGITREKVIDLATGLAIETAEKDLTLTDLTQADAIFTTNSVRGILPIHEVLSPDGVSLWQEDSSRNPVVTKLRPAYDALHP